MTLSRTQVQGLFIVLLVALSGAFLVKDAGQTAMLAVIAVGIAAAAVFAFMGGGGGTDLRGLSEAVRGACDGERQAVPAGASVEVARVYEELAALATKRRRDDLLVDRRVEEVAKRVRALDGLVARVVAVLDTQGASASDAARLGRDLLSGMRGVGTGMEALEQSTLEVSTSLGAMKVTSAAVAHNVGELGGSVRETVGSIEEMAHSIHEVAKNVDALALSAEETSASMNEMDVSIDQVQSNANETARLSEEVAFDAEKGAEAILNTISEIYRIKESSQEAVSVISNLGSRIDAIGQIVNVIDDVAEQTNLLALNAAIIAAQAGEQGKGFAVVADEIKDLAERAGASTREITDLIKTIQAESRNAITAVERGANNVDRGVEVSNDAERALKKILESSQKSTNMVRAIARATVEQAKGSKQVTDAIGRIAAGVQHIAAATAQQARGSQIVIKNAAKINASALLLERTVAQQVSGSVEMQTHFDKLSVKAAQLTADHLSQSRATDQLLVTILRVDEGVSAGRVVGEQLTGAIGKLSD